MNGVTGTSGYKVNLTKAVTLLRQAIDEFKGPYKMWSGPWTFL